MAILLPDKKILFIQTPGTGSTSIEESLLKYNKGISIGEKHCSVQDLFSSNQLTCPVEDLRIISFVRNPFDWYVAEWYRLKTKYVWNLLDNDDFYSKDKIKKHELVAACAMDFSSWIYYVLVSLYELDKKPEQCMFSKWTDNASSIYKYEDIKNIPDWFLRSFDLDIKLSPINVQSGKKPYWSYHSHESRNLITQISSKTLLLYDYKF